MTEAVSQKTDYQRLGGEQGVSEIIQRFIEKVYGDMIIGFLFQSIDQKNLIQREIEFASRHLGGPQVYGGRPIGQVHQKHPINKGHFHRRLWLLSQTLDECAVEDDIKERWLAHNRQLELLVTDGTDCVPQTPA